MAERPTATVKSWARTNWILVVDDDEVMRASTRSTLEEAGYRVYVAENGEEAVECCKVAQESGYPFDSVIFGRNVQGRQEVIGKLLEIDPDAKISIRSGNFEDPGKTEM